MSARAASWFVLPLLLGVAACTNDDGGGGGAIDAVADDTDAASCDLPSTTISCTVGDDTPCTDLCAGAYCFAFGTGGGTGAGMTICTKNCTTVADCPEGWSCNMMGRCRGP